MISDLQALLVLAASAIPSSRILKAVTEGYALQEIVGGNRAARAVMGLNRSLEKNLDQMSETVDEDRVLAQVGRLGARIITWDDHEYPARLKHIWDPPPILFVKGDRLDIAGLRLAAVVGARNADAYGLRVTREICGELAAAGVCVVSGLARGIDREAHKAALDSEGRTFAVLGSGLMNIYPANHKKLAECIAGQGTLISEFLPETRPFPANFPRRNRIISGLSEIIVVVQAGLKSGSLITATFGLEQGRDVMAVPGRVDDVLARGTLRLIGDGAGLALSGAHVLASMGIRENESLKTAQMKIDKEVMGNNKKDGSSDLSSIEQCVYNILCDGDATADELAQRTGHPPGILAATLSGLFVRGLVRQEAGGRWGTVGFKKTVIT